MSNPDATTDEATRICLEHRHKLPNGFNSLDQLTDHSEDESPIMGNYGFLRTNFSIVTDAYYETSRLENSEENTAKLEEYGFYINDFMKKYVLDFYLPEGTVCNDDQRRVFDNFCKNVLPPTRCSPAIQVDYERIANEIMKFTPEVLKSYLKLETDIF
jgi:hypothetical protein